MKPFNLKEYLENPSRKVVTRDGRNARIICTDSKLELYPIIALIKVDDRDCEEIAAYTGDGVGFVNEIYDLFFVSENYEGKNEKFDPKTLQPYDKVLVRDRACQCWIAVYFSHINDSNPICNICSWKQCIPYNEDTKHLTGTREDCPDYYKWWEE